MGSQIAAGAKANKDYKAARGRLEGEHTLLKKKSVSG